MLFKENWGEGELEKRGLYNIIIGKKALQVNNCAFEINEMVRICLHIQYDEHDKLHMEFTSWLREQKQRMKIVSIGSRKSFIY